jgi:hypothetical protein
MTEPTARPARDRIKQCSAHFGFETFERGTRTLVVQLAENSQLRIVFDALDRIIEAEYDDPASPIGYFEIAGSGKLDRIIERLRRTYHAQTAAPVLPAVESTPERVVCADALKPGQLAARVGHDDFGQVNYVTDECRGSVWVARYGFDTQHVPASSHWTVREPAAPASRPERGVDAFDEIERSDAAAEQFERDPQNRGSIGPRIPSRAEVKGPRESFQVGPVTVDVLGPWDSPSVEVGTWDTDEGTFVHALTLSREEADALHTALGRALLG